MIQINTHLRTSNIYVQRQIVRDNIARIKNFKDSKNWLALSFQQRSYYKKMLFAQTNLVVKLNKKIREIEQLSFPFGGIISNENE